MNETVQMDNRRLPEMVLDEKILWKVTCEKTMTEVGREHYEGLVTVGYETGGD